MSRQQHFEQLCGPDCKYRALYEGTQKSLADLATRQADALGRLGRLRTAIILGIKRILPKEFAEAEHALGMRLSEVDDDLLSAYLESFLHLAAGKTPATGGDLARLRAGLERLGVDVAGAFTISDLAAVLERRAGTTDLAELFVSETWSTPSEQVAPVIPTPRPLVPKKQSGARRTAPTGRPTGLAPHGENGDDPGYDPRYDDPSYQDPSYGSEEYPDYNTPQGVDTGSTTQEPALLDVTPQQLPVGSPSTQTAAPAQADPTHIPVTSAQSAPMGRVLPPRSGEAVPGPLLPASPAELEELFSGPSITLPAEHTLLESDQMGSLDDLFTSETPPVPEPVPRPLRSRSRRPAAPAKGTALAGPWAGSDEPAEHQLPESNEEVTEAAHQTGSDTTAATDSAIPRPAQQSAGLARSSQPSLKPQLVPRSTKSKARTAKRPIRASSTPGSAQPDDTVATILDKELRDRLVAAVCIPRPVFTADLVELVGSADLVAAWEAEWSTARDLAIRFTAPKPRHKLRGALIFPQEFLRNATAEFKRSLWARVLSTYRGAKLYELGVLLHRFSEEVVSDELGPSVAVFHLSRPQGLIGVVVVMDTSLGAEGDTRTALVGALDTLMSERLVQIAVLSTNAEILDSISEVVAEEAAAHEWVPPAPVTLSKSWEFATQSGVALPLLGA